MHPLVCSSMARQIWPPTSSLRQPRAQPQHQAQVESQCVLSGFLLSSTINLFIKWSLCPFYIICHEVHIQKRMSELLIQSMLGISWIPFLSAPGVSLDWPSLGHSFAYSVSMVGCGQGSILSLDPAGCWFHSHWEWLGSVRATVTLMSWSWELA